jgi:hypothetical protein
MALVTTMLISISRPVSADRSSARPVTATTTKAPITASSSATRITTGTRSEPHRMTMIR